MSEQNMSEQKLPNQNSRNPLSLIAKANSLAEKGIPFQFWELLDKIEEISDSEFGKVFGEVEEGVIVKGNLSLGKGSLIKSGSRIEGNVYIGENCSIGPNAYLRSGAIVADNCHIGTSEIKNSIILSGSKVPHFSYVGDSVICRNCNLGAGTKIANLRHDKETVKVIFDGQKFDSKRKKLGALLLDNVRTGINSSLNCGSILAKGETVKPGEFRK